MLNALLFAGFLFSQISAPTLRDVIYDKRLGADPQLPSDVLNKKVESYVIDGDATSEVVLAFLEPVSTEPGKANIVRWDLVSGEWRHTDISDETSPANAIIQIRRAHGYIYLDTHINPSAGRLVVLSKELKVLGGLDGWSLAILPDGSVVYHRNQIHFAPTHSVEIAVFDPATLKDRQIYPLKPDNPPRNSALTGRIALDPSSGTMTFTVRVEDSRDVRVSCGPTDRLEQLQCRLLD